MTTEPDSSRTCQWFSPHAENEALLRSARCVGAAIIHIGVHWGCRWYALSNRVLERIIAGLGYDRRSCTRGIAALRSNGRISLLTLLRERWSGEGHQQRPNQHALRNVHNGLHLLREIIERRLTRRFLQAASEEGPFIF